MSFPVHLYRVGSVRDGIQTSADFIEFKKTVAALFIPQLVDRCSWNLVKLLRRLPND